MTARLRRGQLAHRDVRLVVLAMVVSSFGGGMFLAGSTIFFTRTVGLSPVELGVGLAVASVVGLLASLPIGSFADYAGTRTVLVVLSVWRAVWFTVLALTGGPIGFTVAAAAQSIGQQSTPPLVQALIAEIANESGRIEAMALVRSARNLGFALGALAAGPLMAADSEWLGRTALIGTAVAILAGGLIMLRLPAPGERRPGTAVGPLAGLRSLGDWRYTLLAASNGILALHMTLLTVGFPLLVLALPQVDPLLAPLIVFVNTVLVVVAQIPFSRTVNNLSQARRSLWLAGLSLAICCTLLAGAFSTDRAWVAAALVVAAALFLTAGELWQATGSWEISYALAPVDRRSSYLSIFALGTAVQQAVGPLVLGGLVLAAGSTGWLALALTFLIGALLTTRIASHIANRPMPATDARTGDPHEDRVEVPE